MTPTNTPEQALASAQSEAALAAEWTKQKLDNALIELAANLIRVVRGAGRPDEIIGNCAGVIKAAGEYRDANKRHPHPYEIAETLLLKHERLSHVDSLATGRQAALHDIVCGSLQFTASKLIGQPLQVHQGRREIEGALRDIDRLSGNRGDGRQQKTRAKRPE
jgi:hypothetical protein